MTKAIFLETNALYTLGPRLENVDLARLQEIRQVLSFELLVAETSWLEYLRHRRKELLDCLRGNRNSRSILEQHGQVLSGFDDAHKIIESSLATVDERYRKRAAEQGIGIVPTAPVDVELLVDMSLSGEPPFEPSPTEPGEKAKEKGFRDAVIMFTMLERIRGQNDVLIVTGDGLLKRGIEKHSPKYQANPRIVGSIADAFKVTREEVVKSYVQRLQQEAQDAKELLNRYRAELVASIAEIKEFTEADLGQSGIILGLSGRKGQALDIDEVLDLTLHSIESAVWKHGQEGTSRILFQVNCTARVLAKLRGNLVVPPSPTFTVGGGKKPETNWWWYSLSEKPVEQKIPVYLYGEATFERVDNDWRLTSMKVDKSISEEWVESMRILGS